VSSARRSLVLAHAAAAPTRSHDELARVAIEHYGARRDANSENASLVVGRDLERVAKLERKHDAEAEEGKRRSINERKKDCKAVARNDAETRSLVHLVVWREEGRGGDVVVARGRGGSHADC
jgi:hypothetical protein